MMVRSVQLSPNVLMPLMGFGTYRLTGAETVHNSLDCALGAGYRLIDTAQLYDNESDVGNSLKILLPKYGLNRENIFVTTKLHVNNMGKEKTRQSLLESLQRLQLDFVDLFLIHYPKVGGLSPKDPLNKEKRRESWLEMEKLLVEGKVRAIGVSNYEIRHLEEIKEYEGSLGVPPAVNQCEFHPHYCRFELVEFCKKHKIQFQAFTSLGRNNASLNDEPVLRQIAESHNVTVSQVLLAWAMHYDIGVIPKSENAERIKSNFDSLKLSLNQTEAAQIRALNRGVSYTLCSPWEVA